MGRDFIALNKGTNEQPSRIHYMDNLRAFAMLLGVFFHAALAYSPALNQVWMAASADNSYGFDIFAFFSHTFRMPLFFIIAGFFTALLVNKRGIRSMLKNRLSRVALPLVIFLPLVIASFALLIGWALENVENKSPMLGLIAYMSQNPDAPAPPLSTGHLWFLYNLTFFYVIAAVLIKLVKFDWMARLSSHPIVFLLLSPLLLLPALLTTYSPLPAPEQFMPQLWSFGFFGLFFAFGWGLFRFESLIDKVAPYCIPLLVFSVIAYAGYDYLIPHSVTLQDVMINATTSPQLTSTNLILSLLEAYISVYMCLVMLVCAKRWANRQSPLVRYIADSSYWVYIVHMPVLWAVQFWLLDTDYPMFVEFLISAFGTIFIGIMSYAALVRWSPIGWLLNGRKAKKTDILPSDIPQQAN